MSASTATELVSTSASAQFSSTGHDVFAARMLVDNRAAFAGAFAREAHNITLPGEGERVQRIDALYREYVARVDATLAMPDRIGWWITRVYLRQQPTGAPTCRPMCTGYYITVSQVRRQWFSRPRRSPSNGGLRESCKSPA